MATAEQNCNDQIMAYEHTAEQMSGNPVVKYYTVTLGNTGHDLGIEKKLQELTQCLKKVLNWEECDFILVYLHFDSRAGTNIEKAVKILNTLSANKPAILVVLHHMSDPESVVPDSSRRVNRENMITVDCLFHEDQGLLQCSKNDEALSKVINWIHIEGILTKPAKHTPNQDTTDNQMLMHHHKKYFTVVIGNTFAHDVGLERKFEELIEGLQKVQTLEECDFILVFCLFDSQCGTDIEPLNMLSSLPDNKAAVVVVLHHTSDPNTIVPDSSGAVNRKNTITVDLLFCKDMGLLTCYKNDEALCKVINWINNADITNMRPRQSQTDEHITNQLVKSRHPKYFTLGMGNTYVSHDVDLERKFEELIEGLQKVQTLEECDFILFFYHFDSQRGTDIEPALNMLSSLPGNKPAVVLVLHHTCDPITIVPDSSGAVNRKNTITVDLLFCKDMGFLTCYKNDEALAKVMNWINHAVITNMGPGQSQTDEHITNQLVKNPHPKHFTLATGNTLGHHVSIERKLQELIPGLQKVQGLEECDFILFFCSVVSRAGTDIEAAVKKLNILPGNRPTVLVVLHHTFDPESVVPDSSRRVKRENTVTVDCLFYEDQGLLHCPKNTEALSKVINWLHIEGILTKPAKQTQNQDHTFHQLWKRHPLKHYSLKTGKILGHDVGIERKLEELIPGLQKVQKLEECDFILVFCPIVSRAGIDIEAAMKELSSLSGTKPAALMVLHHTFDPEQIVPDSKMTVKRDHLITVDCLFHEDHGLLRCNKNNEACILVSEWIKTQVLPMTKKGNMFNKKGNMATDESRGGYDLPGPAARRRRVSDSSQDLTN